MAIPANNSPIPDRLNASRSQFLDGLPPRLNTLSAMVDALLGKSDSRAENLVLGSELGPLLRRLKAMRGAADTVGLGDIADAFDELVNDLTPTPAGPEALVRTKLGLHSIGQLGRAARGEPSSVAARGVADEQRLADACGPVGPFTVVALASESQREILQHALERGEEFGLHCTQDAAEASVLLRTHDPDMFVVDGRRPDAVTVVKAAQGVPTMVVDARDGDEFRRTGARWVAQRGEHYETVLLTALRQGRRSQSMIVPKGETAVSLEGLVAEIGREVSKALLEHAHMQGTAAEVMIEDRTPVRAVVWSMLARLRELVTELSAGAVRYDPLTPDGTMILTGREIMRRGARARAAKDQLRGRTVLLAEHDPSVEWYLSSLLRSNGATVLEAQDGATALSLARSKQPDLIICDVMLPGIDGFALCRNLKRDIVLSDVPVILLSWKEDLLQRVRELGAGADGYLAKEAEASVILERCAEALEPRARIEKRFREEQVVRGRLDGITPRLVLELASHSISNAKITFQDAAFQYEVNIGDRRILRASRTDASGEVQSGERVLPGLLGMRAGRFIVEHVDSMVQAQLYGSLQKVIEPFVARARRASRKLKGAELYAVAHLEVDTTALGPYIAVSPPIVGKLVERLAAGTAPADLLQSVSAGLLESVLEDLALRGGVLRAFDAAGVDVLEANGNEGQSAFDADLQTPPGKRVAAASGAPRIGAGSGPAEVEAAAAFAEQANASSRPTSRPPPHSDRGQTAVVVAGPGAASDPDGERRSSIPPATNRATVLGIAPEAPRPERLSSLPPLPQASLRKDASDPHASLSLEAVSLSEAVTPPSGTAWSLTSEPIAAALMASPTGGEVGPRYDSSSESSAPCPVSSPHSGEPERVEVGGSPPGAFAAEAVDLAQVVAAGMVATPAMPSAEDVAQDNSNDSDPELHDSELPEASLRPELPSEGDSDLHDSELSEASLRPELPSEGELLKGKHTLTGMGHAHAADAAASARSDAWRVGRATQAKRLVPAVSLPAPAPPPVASATGVGRSRPVETTAEVVAKAGLPRTFVSRAKVIRTLRKAMSVAQPVAVVGVAAVGAFVGMNHLAGELAPNEQAVPQQLPDLVITDEAPQADLALETAQADPQGASLVGIEPPGAAAAAQPPVISLLDLPLPEGLAVAPEKGLLEINSQGQHKLYVGNVFVGRGPVRRIPIDPGSHRVTIKGDGVETAQEVIVKAGRRLRVQFSEASQ